MLSHSLGTAAQPTQRPRGLSTPIGRNLTRVVGPKVVLTGTQLAKSAITQQRCTIRASVTATAATAPPGTAPPMAVDENAIFDTVIVGAGVSGLTTAMALKAEHAGEVSSFLVTESRDRVGGNITTVANESEGLLWEEGPNSFQPSDAVLKAAVDAGVADELALGDPTAPRFVYWEGRLRPTPSGLDALTFDLMSIFGKIRAGLGAVGIKPAMPPQEESVEQFVRRNLGAEAFERLIDPFCSGVYAGDPAKLSMKAAFGKVYDLELKGGSIIGGVLKLMQEKKANPAPPRDARLPPKPAGQTVGSFKKGLKTLPEAMAAKVAGAVRTSWTLQSIAKEGGVYRLRYDTPEGSKEVRTRTVALTVPSYVAAELVRPASGPAADALAAVDYPPVCAVTLAYPESAIKPERLNSAGNLPGFGQLHPRSQGITTLGTIYSSSLFPGRVPKGQVLLLAYIGGAKNRGIKEQPDDDIVAQVDRDLRKMLVREDAPPPRKVGVRTWHRAIPQFNIGHLDAMASVQEELLAAGWDGVMLGGNYVCGVALGKCMEYGYEYAGKVAKAAAAAKK